MEEQINKSLRQLDFLAGYWRADSTIYNLANGGIASTERYMMYNAWEKALENKWMLTHKYDHVEFFGYDPSDSRFLMWNMSSHRIHKIKKWVGTFENGKLILHLQEVQTRSIPFRVHHDSSGAYIVTDTVLGSYAEEMGLVAGDLITCINGMLCTVENQRTLLAEQESSCNSIKITVKRNKTGVEETMTMPLIPKPPCRLIISPPSAVEPITWRYELDEKNDGKYLLKERLILREIS